MLCVGYYSSTDSSTSYQLCSSSSMAGAANCVSYQGMSLIIYVEIAIVVIVVAFDTNTCFRCSDEVGWWKLWIH